MSGSTDAIHKGTHWRIHLFISHNVHQGLGNDFNTVIMPHMVLWSSITSLICQVCSPSSVMRGRTAMLQLPTAPSYSYKNKTVLHKHTNTAYFRGKVQSSQQSWRSQHRLVELVETGRTQCTRTYVSCSRVCKTLHPLAEWKSEHTFQPNAMPSAAMDNEDGQDWDNDRWVENHH